jgi:cation transport regulator ChaC
MASGEGRLILYPLRLAKDTGTMTDKAELWVFGYGSLMWRPGFAFVERHLATVHGFHRSLCVYSHVHRGTAARPGLVLGLDRGGSCRGVAFKVAALDREATIAYLREREQVTMVYREVVLRALHHQSAAVVLAHNHPSGSVQPSRADEALTHNLKASLALVDVRVLDHIIVGHGQTLSMAEHGLL